MNRNQAILAVLFGMLISAPARAQDCDAMVVDQTGKLGAGGVNRVVTAANSLVNQGAEIRVRVLTSSVGAGYGNLDEYKMAMQRACPSWQSADGHMKNTLIAVIIAMDKKTGIFFGDAYKAALENQWRSVVSGSMNPRFRDGKFADGIIAGLQKIGQLIQVISTPPPAPVQIPVVIQQQAPSQPTDFSGLWVVMELGLGLSTLGALAFGVWFLLQARGKRRAAQQQAQAKSTACAAGVLELDEPLLLLEARLNSMAAKVATDDLAETKGLLEKAKAGSRETSMRFSELKQSSANNPDFDGLSVEQYEGIATAYEQVLALVRRAKEITAKLEKSIQTAQKQVEDAKPKIDALSAEIDGTIAAVDAVTQQAYKTADAEKLLQEAGAALNEARIAFQEKRYGAVAGFCAKGTTGARNAAIAAGNLAKKREGIETNRTSMIRRLNDVQGKIGEGRKTFEEISSKYAEGSWAAIRGNGTEATKRFDAALRAAEESGAVANMDRQEWTKAEEIIKQGNAWLDEAESFMRSVASLKSTLETAKADAQPEIDAAQADIDTAVAYVKKFDDDIDDALWDDLKAAAEQLKTARQELAAAKPDYFKAVKIAKTANAAADQILKKGQTEHEAAERQRRRAVSSLRDAEAAISRSKEYIEDHQRDVRKTAKTASTEAGAAIQLAISTRDLASRIKHADNAHDLADEAYKKAKADVADAEAERARLRRQAEEERARVQRQADEARAVSQRRSEERTGASDAFVGGVIGGYVGSRIGRSEPEPTRSSDFGGWGQSSDGGGGSVPASQSSDGGGGSVSWETSSDGGGGDSSPASDPSPSSDGGGGSTDW
ncbi:MAG: TPM domain-containing protein [Patescibacteria group bacterium]